LLYNEKNKLINSLNDSPDLQKQYKDELNELINTENSINKMDKDQLVKFLYSRGDYQQYDGLKQEALEKLAGLEPQFDRRIFMKIGEAVFDINGITFKDDGVEATAPEIREGRTFVPLRFIVENMDGEVQWDGQLKKITIKAKENTIVLKIGEKTIWENGVPKSIDAAPVIVNGRTIVPVRFIAESLGMKVDWLESDQIILISGKQ
ncbi:MAG TPA: copper amine oxidase N-terminal domain-containing protein, partial [Clostridia bacterium]